jgi:hypothetical protein
MLPIDEWDEPYVLSDIQNAPETESFERKESVAFGNPPKGPEKEIMAREICAFANAGGGVLAYGLPDGGGLDAGVPDAIGSQSVSSWAEAIIPKLHHPPVTSCVVRYTAIGSLGAGRGVLAISVPSSERRPHWSTQGYSSVAYLRVGEHSAPMHLQTLLDISSRGTAPRGEIGSVAFQMRQEYQNTGKAGFLITLMIRVAGGPISRTWGVDISLDGKPGDQLTSPHAGLVTGSSWQATWFLEGERQTLFPGRWTHVPKTPILVLSSTPGDRVLRITLFLEAAIPVHSAWRLVPQGPGKFDIQLETDNKAIAIP